jgi:hypothetical protein
MPPARACAAIAGAAATPRGFDMHKLAGFLVAAFLMAGLAGAASAQPRHDERRHDEGRHDRGGWHDRDIHRFHDRDFGVWRTGRWYHGPHGGRLGWWWVLGNAWYYYPQPIYPYPDPYTPPVVVPPPPGPPRQVFYYCPRPRGYFPYVQACTVPWRAVPG